MTRTIRAVFGLLCAALPASPSIGASTPTEMQRADALAGKDLRSLYDVLCPAEVLHPAAVDIADRASWYTPPVAPFDDLYFLGEKGVSAWAIKTDDGLILVDSLFGYSVGPEIVDGLRSLGLDPATIRYVVVTHAHTDHYGGARYLQDTYGARVVASRTDWDGIEKATRGTDPKPRRDIVVDGTMKLQLGKTTVRLVETPGHTPGTLSLLFPVHDRGKVHVVALWGGTAFNSRTRQQYETMATSAEQFAGLARKAHADVFLSNHPVFDDTFAKIDKGRNPDGSSAFVTGPKTIARAMTIVRYCTDTALHRDFP